LIGVGYRRARVLVGFVKRKNSSCSGQKGGPREWGRRDHEMKKKRGQKKTAKKFESTLRWLAAKRKSTTEGGRGE